MAKVEEMLSLGIPEQEPMDVFRTQRAQLFSWTDWTQLADAPLTDDEKKAWQVYRQQLRDLPSSKGFDPADPKWPTMPGKENDAET